PPTAAHIGPSRWTASSGGECAGLSVTILARVAAGAGGPAVTSGVFSGARTANKETDGWTGTLGSWSTWSDGYSRLGERDRLCRPGRRAVRCGISTLRNQVNGRARVAGAGAPGSARPGSFNGAGARDHP